eukprot:CAMPEP_0114136698 /NCGR_PEP_ID=MMETSP0043_2-20121206/15376_1 /TAXON_ID=464988 /ORGANISM="Hemiselmis andersenii, Strain CCMP644" /LENGTH=65 /DNA_ID=CAMNT_0001230515 /DNA_START=359 /DNA_END=556 /DNA_ORIENTATION=+
MTPLQYRPCPISNFAQNVRCHLFRLPPLVHFMMRGGERGKALSTSWGDVRGDNGLIADSFRQLLG